MTSILIRAAIVGAVFVSFLGSASADPILDQLSDVFSPVDPPRRHHPTRRHAFVPTSGSMVASYYGSGEKLNAHTANGERFNSGALTAAHRSLPFGTLLSVCYRRCTTVRINDRGPALSTGRSLDLSRGAAQAIGMPGVARVNVSVLGEP